MGNTNQQGKTCLVFAEGVLLEVTEVAKTVSEKDNERVEKETERVERNPLTVC